MTETLNLSLTVKLPWWLPGYIWFWTLVAFLGFPVNVDKCAQRIARHTKVEAHG